MAGLVRGAEGLVGGLKRLWELANELEEGKEGLSKVGKVFQEASERNPGYFVTGRELPKRGSTPQQIEAFLNQKHGTERYSPDLTSSSQGVYGGAGQMASMKGEGPLSEQYEAVRSGVLKPGLLKRPRAGMGPDTDSYVIDTMSLGKNAEAKQLYPAFWDWVLSQPDAANVAQALSNSNSFRRSANMAGFYEKYGEPANRIIMSPDQLVETTGNTKGFRQANAFHKLPPEGQVGALNALVGQKAGSEVDRVMRGVMDRVRGDEPDRWAEYLRRAERLGVSPGSPYSPTTDVEPSHFRDLGQLLWAAGRDLWQPSAVGESSLRRAAIASDALKGLDAKDLDTQRWLTDRLGRKQGGSVPGPLTHVGCSCGG